MSENPVITAGQLRELLSECDDETRIRLDIPVLADTYDCVSMHRHAHFNQPDELILGGYDE